MTLCGLIVAALAVACLEERPRPAPPVLTLVVDNPSPCSPDTITGAARAEDPDGIDSLWIVVDQVEAGADGLFREVFETRFRMALRAGLSPGAGVEVVVRARDLAGFSDTLRRTLTVILCTATT